MEGNKNKDKCIESRSMAVRTRRWPIAIGSIVVRDQSVSSPPSPNLREFHFRQ